MARLGAQDGGGAGSVDDSEESPTDNTSDSQNEQATSASTSRSERIEETKRRAVEAAAAIAQSIDADTAVDKREKDRSKKFVEEVQKTGEMAAPTDHSLETMDNSAGVEEMARASAAEGDDLAGGSAIGPSDGSFSEQQRQQLRDSMSDDSGSTSNGGGSSSPSPSPEPEPAAPPVDGDPFDGSQFGSDVFGPDEPRSAGGQDDSADTPADPPDAQGSMDAADRPRGIEDVYDGEIGDQARDFEQEVMNEFPGLESDQVRIIRDGDTLRADIDDAYLDDYAAERQADYESSVRGARRAVTRDTGVDPVERQRQEQQEQFDQSVRGARRAVEADTGEDPLDLERDRQQERQERAVRGATRAVTRDTGRNPWTVGVSADFASSVEERTGLEAGEDFEVVRTGDTQNARLRTRLTDQGRERLRERQREEQFGDFDWSFGLGGPEDEVEQALEGASQYISEGSHDAAQALFGAERGLFRESAGEEVLRAAGQDDLARTYEEGLRNFGMGAVQGAGAIANVPGLAKSGLEAAELVGWGASETASGNFSEAQQKTTERSVAMGSAAVDQATENTAQTAGLLTGAFAGSYGAISTASRVSPRAGQAARWAIQPGEEALGSVGYRVTRATRGEASAERWFPNREPLIFSEEAALSGARRAASRVRNVSPGRRIRGAARNVNERTPNARLVRDPDSGPISVDSELTREIGDAASRFRERVTPSARGGSEGVAPLVRAGQTPTIESGLAAAGSRAHRAFGEMEMPSARGGSEGVAPLVRGAQRPSLEGMAASAASRTAREAQDLIDTARAADWSASVPGSGREAVGSLVQGAQRPSLEGAAAGVASRTASEAQDLIDTVRAADWDWSMSAPGGTREGVAPLIQAGQGPTIEGGASRAFNYLAFEGRRRGLQAQEAASDLPGRIADTRRQYELAVRSDVTEMGSRADTRVRQYRNLIRNWEGPSGPSFAGPGVRERLSGLGDLTLRLEPSARYWERGGSPRPDGVDVGDFEGFDVEGMLGDADAGQSTRVETEADQPSSTSMVDQDAGDGLVARQTRAEAEAELIDTSRTGTGTDAVNDAWTFPASRPLAAAMEGRGVAGAERSTTFGSERFEMGPGVSEFEGQGVGTELDVEQGSDLVTSFRTGLEMETEQDISQGQDLNVGLEVGQRLDQRQEAETELELESEPAFEGEPRGNSRQRRPWERDFRAPPTDGFERGERGLATGWFNEFVTAFGTGAGPRELASDSGVGAVALTEQRQTAAQAEGGAGIEAAEAMFTFEGDGAVGVAGESGGDDEWFDVSL